MKEIKCCKDCKPPKRHREPTDCHMDCEEYLAEKAAYEEDKVLRKKYMNEHGDAVDLYYKVTIARRNWRKKRRNGK